LNKNKINFDILLSVIDFTGELI